MITEQITCDECSTPPINWTLVAHHRLVWCDCRGNHPNTTNSGMHEKSSQPFSSKVSSQQSSSHHQNGHRSEGTSNFVALISCTISN
ncbi:hypothetical protein BLOT_016368 [Blomia tropicalis]|nr:hypothetical protein BLOT_016368 [Blomia tropicalis]